MYVFVLLFQNIRMLMYFQIKHLCLFMKQKKSYALFYKHSVFCGGWAFDENVHLIHTFHTFAQKTSNICDPFSNNLSFFQQFDFFSYLFLKF